ncbi:MAG: hypothetical protein JSU72_15185 [Deltaproteobacteria bacterium]|nr:MAG: hypothetical protein JSU72_15185 [Deltaproteobacteria bacterium]
MAKTKAVIAMGKLEQGIPLIRGEKVIIQTVDCGLWNLLVSTLFNLKS